MAVLVRLAKSQVTDKIEGVSQARQVLALVGGLLANPHILALGSQAVSEDVHHQVVSVHTLQAAHASLGVLQPDEAVAEVASVALRVTT